VLAIDIVFSCTGLVGHSLNYLVSAFVMTVFLVVTGAVVGAVVGYRNRGKTEVLDSIILPDVDKAARAHFTPSSPPPAPDEATEDKIKQPDEPDTTESTP
jgi:hypothetical protein